MSDNVHLQTWNDGDRCWFADCGAIVTDWDAELSTDKASVTCGHCRALMDRAEMLELLRDIEGREMVVSPEVGAAIRALLARFPR